MNRNLICSYRNFNMLKEYYKKRSVIAYTFCPDNEYYYYSPKGKVRKVSRQDNTIWTSTEDPWIWKRIK